jgi:transcription elongation factor S-II
LKQPEDIVATLEKVKSFEMSFTLLQESELGKVLHLLKKSVKDNDKVCTLINDILVAWKEIAAKELAARKRKREENAGVGDALASPTPEKKSKLVESSSSSSTPHLVRASSSAANASNDASELPSGPSPTLSIPTVSLRKDFVNRITESLKTLPAAAIEKQTRAALDTAILIESAVFDHFKSPNEDYKTHLRLVNFHLKQNVALRESVALTHIEPSKLASMNPDDLVSDEMKAEAARIANEVTEARKPIPLEANCTTELCKKCHGKKIHVREAQTRSSDEPMTQFFTCLDCKLKWKK